MVSLARRGVDKRQCRREGMEVWESELWMGICRKLSTLLTASAPKLPDHVSCADYTCSGAVDGLVKLPDMECENNCVLQNPVAYTSSAMT